MSLINAPVVWVDLNKIGCRRNGQGRRKSRIAVNRTAVQSIEVQKGQAAKFGHTRWMSDRSDGSRGLINDDQPSVVNRKRRAVGIWVPSVYAVHDLTRVNGA